MDYWGAFQAAKLCDLKLAQMGIEVEFTCDPDDILWSVDAIGKGYLTPWLDPRLNDFNQSNFFWMIARKKGVPIMVGGGRCFEFGNGAAQGIGAIFDRSYGARSVYEVRPEIDAALRGRVVYLGDLKSAASSGLGRKAVRYFLGLANHCAVTHLGGGPVFSFMRFGDVDRGSADVNGLHSRVLSPFKWSVVPEHRSDDEVLVYRSPGDHAEYFERLRRELAKHELVSMGSSAYPQHESPTAPHSPARGRRA